MVELLFDFNFVNQEFISLIQKFFSFLINNETDVSLGYFFMSITTYDFFYKLTNKDLIKDEGLPNFSLYGFVIYDHVEHAEFKKNLEDNYKYLDQKSGENFLFFSVIELDEEKEKYFKGKSYYEAYKKLEHDNSGITNPVTVKNSNTLAYTLATHLEIDLKYLPVLVVSKDLAFGHKEVIPVTAENFWDKLSKLDYIATFKLKDIHDDKFKDLLIKHGVIAEDDFNISSPNVKLNKALYDATGCFEIANNNFTAQTHIDYLVDCLNKEILNYKNTDERENLEKSLEIEDFSPVAINLAKSFENEIILSYYNWLRKVKGVPMPEYYGRLLKGKEVKYDRYDLNRNIKGELIPLELGSSVLCLKKYFEENNILPEYHNIEDFNGSGEYMLKIYFEINNIRNSICHPKNIFTKTDLIELENKISSIYNGPLGLKIRDLKNSLTS